MSRWSNDDKVDAVSEQEKDFGRRYEDYREVDRQQRYIDNQTQRKLKPNAQSLGHVHHNTPRSAQLTRGTEVASPSVALEKDFGGEYEADRHDNQTQRELKPYAPRHAQSAKDTAVASQSVAQERDFRREREDYQEADCQQYVDNQTHRELEPYAQDLDYSAPRSAQLTRLATLFPENRAFAGIAEQNRSTDTKLEFTFTKYMKSVHLFIQYQDIKKGFRGFLDILYCQKRHPWGLGAKIAF